MTSSVAYSDYSQSGVTWIGAIPSHWTCVALKNLDPYNSTLAQTGPFGTQLHADDYVDDGIPLILIKNVRHLTFDISEMPKITPEDAERLSAYRVIPGDIVFSRVGSIGRIALVTSEETGWVISGQMLRLRINNDNLDEQYSIYALSSRIVEDEISYRSVGSTRESINTDILRNIRLPIPPLEEQLAIAKFLDYETAKIDALIQKQQQLIALLKEKRQAVISHAVTKGLNPDAPMRDSGVEWLGKIPAHWTACPLMHIVDPLRQVMYGIVLPGPDVPVGVPIVKGGDVKSDRLSLQLLKKTTLEIEKKYVRSRLKANDLVYAIRGGVGDVELVPAEIEGANLTQDAARIAPAQGILPSWLLMSLRGDYFWRQIERRIVGATVRGINIRDLKRGIVALPPENEQRAISDFLQHRLAKLERLHDNLEAFLVGLQERSTALISAAVTGKIDVRGWMAPESETKAEVA